MSAEARRAKAEAIPINRCSFLDGFRKGLNPSYALEQRLASGPLSHDAAVPFFHFYGGKMQKDVLEL